jgi:replicative DNA helicase
MLTDEKAELVLAGYAIDTGKVVGKPEHCTIIGVQAVLRSVLAGSMVSVSVESAKRLGVPLAWLMEAAENSPASDGQLEAARGQVFDLFRRRIAAEHAKKLLSEAHDFSHPMQTKDTLYDIGELVDAAKEGFEAYGTGIKFGLSELDAFMGGLMSGQVFTVISGSGIGKTMLAMNLFHRALAYTPSLKSIFFSFEMDAKSFAKRHLAIFGNTSMKALHSDSLSPARWAEIKDKSTNSYLSRCKVEFFPKNLAEMASILEERPDVRLVAIDYLQFIPRGKDEQVNQLMLDIKTFAKRCGVAVILLAQIDKQAGRDKENPRPSSYDAVGGHGIKANSDWCYIIHREGEKTIGYFDKDREPMQPAMSRVVYELDYRRPDGIRGVRLRDLVPIEGMPSESELD